MIFEKLKIKNTTKTIAFGAAAMIAVLGFTIFSGEYCKKNIPSTSENTNLPQNVQTAQANNANAVQMYKLTRYKKAPISDYDMSSKIYGNKDNNSQENQNEFSVTFPDSGEKYRNDKPAPAKLTATRSISNEFYTVFDENSGKTVTLDGHELLCQVVNNEVGDSWDSEAIKSQAIATYCYMRYGDANGYIRQVGLKNNYSSYLEKCVSSVEGQAVYYNGTIINGVYSASTAGYSTASDKVWGGNLGYLKAVKSSFDNNDPHWQDKTTYTVEKVKNKLEKALKIKLSDDVKKWFKVESCYSVKYIDQINIDGQKTISGVKLCKILDLMSNAMDISYKSGEFTFATYGWGHGVGLSQWGAKLYAEHGWTYDQILRHYYVDTKIALSDVNEQAVERGEMSDADLEAEAEKASVEIHEKDEETSEETEQDKNTQTDENEEKTDDSSNTSSPKEPKPTENKQDESSVSSTESSTSAAETESTQTSENTQDTDSSQSDTNTDVTSSQSEKVNAESSANQT